MLSEPVKPYFTRGLRVLSFCPGASKCVIFCGNGGVNGVMEMKAWCGNINCRNSKNLVKLIVKNLLAYVKY